jgi:hypothetical protein
LVRTVLAYSGPSNALLAQQIEEQRHRPRGDALAPIGPANPIAQLLAPARTRAPSFTPPTIASSRRYMARLTLRPSSLRTLDKNASASERA